MAEIAVIDDDPHVVGLLEAALSPPHHVIGYASGQAAIEGLLRVPPEVVLLDIDLGDMSGVQLARAIREHAAIGDVPILAVTAHSEEEQRARLIAEGFTSFIAKPIVDPQVIIDAIDAALTLDADASWETLDETLDDTLVADDPLRRTMRRALAALKDGDAGRAEQLLARALSSDELDQSDRG
ncbi:MAG: Response regulator receiver modulated diguanylate cyclase [bacterium]|nr:Response regulator receiver modulated diguanylate cyclase [bacterium]